MSTVSVTVTAGPLQVTGTPISPNVGQLVRMGHELYISFKPEIAQQWIDELTKITTKESNA